NRFGICCRSPARQLGMNPPVTVGAVGVVETESDLRGQYFTPTRGGRRLTAAPCVEARSGHFRPTAHGYHGMIAFFGGDERVFQCHRCFFAKKATDFPRKRFSSSSSRTLRSNSFSRARSDISNPGSLT